MSAHRQADRRRPPRRQSSTAIRRHSSTAIRRRRISALLIVAALVTGVVVLALPSGESRSEDSSVTLSIPGSSPVRLSQSRARLVASGRRALPVPSSRVVSRGAAEITYELDRDAALRQLARVVGTGGTVEIEERAVSVEIDAPIVKQVYTNNCETATLEMLLATRGVERDQLTLQDEIRRDGTLDPRTAPDGTRIWGNPSEGFVGRVEGGGVAGGFGVYPKPVIDLAARWIERPDNLSARSPEQIYERLLEGRAVFAWIGLSDGPYESWRGPRGETVTVNYGEHTVLLRGLSGDQLLVNDPLSGERQIWSKQEFEEKWDLLNRRAISA